MSIALVGTGVGYEYEEFGVCEQLSSEAITLLSLSKKFNEFVQKNGPQCREVMEGNELLDDEALVWVGLDALVDKGPGYFINPEESFHEVDLHRAMYGIKKGKCPMNEASVLYMN